MLSAEAKQTLERISQDHGFSSLIEEILLEKPQIPGFNAESTNEDHWKLATGRSQGFELAVNFLRQTGENNER